MAELNKNISHLTPHTSHLNTILIANRGEIASRVIRTCKKMGIKSVAVFSEADRNMPYVSEADMAVFIGESAPNLSYLNQEKIIQTAQKVKADAIHPGYGFLSENADFARKCAENSLIFIGPNPEAIEAMGSKSHAKTLMQKNKVPTVPGYQGSDQSIEKLSSEAIKIGFPVLLKATAGGGGKGMRIVHQKKDLKKAIKAAQREAKSAFGNDEMIIEKYIASGRHIEFQIFGDKHGNAIHILERECSIQRRYQKVMEESPSPVLTEKLRQKMGEAAVNAAKVLNYDNAGTVEFIFDEKSGDFYFLEVNTRLQVEHPITEEITGLDLVQMQIESAQGLPLKISQEDVKSEGYAMELRLYAEDASNDFLPATGKIERFDYPKVEGLRMESAVKSSSEISVFYDPMIAKIIVKDENRTAVHRKMKYVLQNLVCLGTTTNQNFLLQLLNHPDFLTGNYDTHFIQNKINLTQNQEKNTEKKHFSAIAATLHSWNTRENNRTLLKSIPSGWRNNFYDYQQVNYKINEEEILVKYHFEEESFTFFIDEETYKAHIVSINQQSIRVELNGVQYFFSLAKRKNTFFIQNEQFGTVELSQKPRFPEKKAAIIEGGYVTPMPSQIINILVKEGQKIKTGDSLVILSSMKMETTIEATKDGVIEEIYTEAGQNVEAGFVLLKIT